MTRFFELAWVLKGRQQADRWFYGEKTSRPSSRLGFTHRLVVCVHVGSFQGACRLFFGKPRSGWTTHFGPRAKLGPLG